MKNYLPVSMIALLLLTAFVFIGCGAKETAPPDAAEVPLTQEPSKETEKPISPEAEIAEKPHAPEQETHQETKPESAVPTVEVPSGSVLHLIPESTLGVIYCPSLTELDNRINMLATDLLPTAEPPEVLAGILADAFGAGFESLAELEEIGLDLNQDFAIFMTALEPPDLSATVHLTNPDAMKQVIDAESEGTAPVEYNGVTYWNAAGGGGSFAIIDNILVFARSPEICENVIDTYKKTNLSITTQPNYTSFLTDVSEGTAQLALHFNLESVIPDVTASLKEELESTTDGLESDPTAMAATPIFESIFKGSIGVLEQVKSLSATLEIDGTDVQLAPFLKFKTGSEIQNALKEMDSHQLALLSELPNQVFVGGGFQGKPEMLAEMNMFWLKMFSHSTEQTDLIKTLTKQIEDFYKTLGAELAFSVNYSSSFLPDCLIIYEVKDEQGAKTYMEDMFLEQIHSTMQLMRDVIGDMPQWNMYDGAHAGTPIMHNGVEINSYIFPNFGSILREMPPEAHDLLPQEWEWYYAFHENRLLLGLGPPELIKTALDQQTETSDTLSENLSYQKLTEVMGSDNNLLLAISPMTAAKNLLPVIARTDPDAAAAIQMLSGMLMNMPEAYSIGFAAKAQENGIGTKLLLTLGDFKQLIQMVVMMQQGMGQMQ